MRTIVTVRANYKQTKGSLVVKESHKILITQISSINTTLLLRLLIQPNGYFAEFITWTRKNNATLITEELRLMSMINAAKKEIMSKGENSHESCISWSIRKTWK